MKHPYLTFFFLIAIALPVLVLVIVAPMSAHNQFIFGLSMIGACLIAHFCSKKHFVSFCIMMVAVVAYMVYIVWTLV